MQSTKEKEKFELFLHHHLNPPILEEKNDFLAHYGAGNAGKWEKGKQNKIKKTKNLLLELQGKLAKAKKKCFVLRKNCKC